VKKRGLPKWAPFVLVGVGAVIVLLAGWEIVLSPKQHTIDGLRRQATLVQQQIATDLSRAATARTSGNAPTIKTADIYKLQTAMPSSADIPDLLLELDQVAKSAGVDLESIGPGTPSPSSGYSTVPVTVTASGNFYAITDLLYRLRNLVYVRDGALQANGRIFTVDSVTLSPNQNLVSANISLTTYVFGSTSTSALAPVPTTPTSTDTTQTTTTTSTDSSSGPSAAGATP
jgi:Tfp pilus assembly protein PilO